MLHWRFHRRWHTAYLPGQRRNLPNSSFVLSRQPDQGYSLRGDGSDYNHLWNGQPTLEALYLSSLIATQCGAINQRLIEELPGNPGRKRLC